jgi:hypothetical protein
MLELVCREWQTRARTIRLKQVRFTCTLSKDCGVGQKHSRVRRCVASFVVVHKLRRAAGDVIDDQIRHDFHVRAERTHVVPGAEPRIDSGVIDWIEARIGAIDGIKKRKQMYSAEYTFQWSLKEALKFPEPSSGKTVDVCDQLRLIVHDSRRVVKSDSLIDPRLLRLSSSEWRRERSRQEHRHDWKIRQSQKQDDWKRSRA